MKFFVWRASDWTESVVEVNTLEELKKFQKDCGVPLVVNFDYHSLTFPNEGLINEIIIYDDYIE